MLDGYIGKEVNFTCKGINGEITFGRGVVKIEDGKLFIGKKEIPDGIKVKIEEKSYKGDAY